MVEAVSLLLERAREIEATMADAFRRGQERDAEIDLRWAGIEERLERIERRLAWLVPGLKPARARPLSAPGWSPKFARSRCTPAAARMWSHDGCCGVPARPGR